MVEWVWCKHCHQSQPPSQPVTISYLNEYFDLQIRLGPDRFSGRAGLSCYSAPIDAASFKFLIDVYARYSLKKKLNKLHFTSTFYLSYLHFNDRIIHINNATRLLERVRAGNLLEIFEKKWSKIFFFGKLVTTKKVETSSCRRLWNLNYILKKKVSWFLLKI